MWSLAKSFPRGKQKVGKSSPSGSKNNINSGSPEIMKDIKPYQPGSRKVVYHSIATNSLLLLIMESLHH